MAIYCRTDVYYYITLNRKMEVFLKNIFNSAKELSYL